MVINSFLSTQIVDSEGKERRLRGSTLERELKVQEEECTLPLHFTDGWNQVQIDLIDFTQRCFGTDYKETRCIKVSSNCQLHRVMLSSTFDLNFPVEIQLDRACFSGLFLP